MMDDAKLDSNNIQPTSDCQNSNAITKNSVFDKNIIIQDMEEFW